MGKAKYLKEPRGRIRELWEIFSDRSCKRILDAGCGIGWFGKYKPNQSIEVWGIDVDKKRVTIASSYEKSLIGDVRNIPFSSNSFDGILAFHILEHVREDLEVMKEFHRILKKGGILVAESPSMWHDAFTDPTHVRAYTKESFLNLARDAKLNPIKFHYLGRGFPGFGKLGLHTLGERLGELMANSLGFRKGYVFMTCEKGPIVC